MTLKMHVEIMLDRNLIYQDVREIESEKSLEQVVVELRTEFGRKFDIYVGIPNVAFTANRD